MNLHVDITENAKKALRLLQKKVGDRSPVYRKIAEKVASDTRKKFKTNNGESWWKKAANTVEAKADATKAEVIATQRGLNLQKFGGTVRPKNGHKNLAIPLRREFRGLSPKRVAQRKLFVLGAKKTMGKRFLAYQEGAAIRVAYLLTPKAVIKPHPDKFLSDDEITASALATVKILIGAGKL